LRQRPDQRFVVRKQHADPRRNVHVLAEAGDFVIIEEIKADRASAGEKFV
jgi:hypothetical protein